MSLYTSAYLKQISKNKTLNESTKMFSEKDKIHASFDIFLSHSYLDKEEVEGLYIELTRMGFKVYVDWIIDPNLDRTNVTKESATLIRNRLRSSKTLLLAVSTNASISKWMPWELGHVDGNTNKCAIIPVSRDANPPKSYKGVEYLSLYPFISKTSIITGIEKIWIIEESKKYVAFDEWLAGKPPYQRYTDIFQ